MAFLDSDLLDDDEYEPPERPSVCPTCNGKGGGRLEHDCPMCQCDEECPDCRGTGVIE